MVGSRGGGGIGVVGGLGVVGVRKWWGYRGFWGLGVVGIRGGRG